MMEPAVAFLDDYFTLFEIPGTKIILVFFVLLLTLVLRKLFSFWVIRKLRRLAADTENALDDALIDILDPPLRFIILIVGLFVIQIILGPVNEYFDRMYNNILEFCFVVVVCWLIYRSADVFTGFWSTVAKRTETELDDLLAPYLKKVIKILAVLIVIIKTAEVFLGMSAAALFGVLGGMGLTLGLVFKDIIANWFACAVIYIDNLFREGDWVQLNDGNLVDADVEYIGIRSTTFRNFDKTVSIVPNATITNSVVKNWSRMYKRRVSYAFKIDNIAADCLQNLLNSIRQLLHDHPEVHQEFHMVNFRQLEGNARVIRLYYFTKTTVWKEHERVREAINLQLLQLFERENLDKLVYTIVDLSDDRPYEYRKQEG
ncbi:mechanosensitive ion channel [candidate division KSB1 bacterium]|nr:mechanosensitive ion channel [candidate division KSB1 bacterium]